MHRIEMIDLHEFLDEWCCPRLILSNYSRYLSLLFLCKFISLLFFASCGGRYTLAEICNQSKDRDTSIKIIGEI